VKFRAGEREPREILVTRLRYLGDVILTTPVLSALAQRFPGAAIDYLCESPYDQALAGNPHLRERIVLPPAEAGGAGDTWRLLRKCRGRYDLVIDLFGNPRSAWLTRLSGARVRAGWGRFPRSLLFNVRPPEGPPFEETTRKQLRLVEPFTGEVESTDPIVYVSERERAEGRRIMEDRGLGTGSIAILTGATWPTREWPADHFVRLAALIRMETRFTPFFLGQPEKRERLEQVRRMSHSKVSILPDCDIRTLAGVLAESRALVAPDGGVMHLAIALGLPTLAIFGSTEPRIWFPYRHLSHAQLAAVPAECRPCHQRECTDPFCLTGQSPESVFRLFIDLLARTEKRTAPP